METGSSLLAQILRERITPAVMVLPTPAVEESCQKNHLTLLELLRPFCILDQIDVPVRTASDQPYRLQEFRLRLFYASKICQPSAETAEEYLLQVVSDSSDDAFAELLGDPKKLDTVQQMVQSESPSSWFQRYSKEFIQSLAFSEHEAIDHPVACLLIVSSRDENPVNKFIDLFNTDQLPALLNDGVMDPKLLKHYVLLHDYQDGPPDRANDILLEMKGTFGHNDCRLLCINSGKAEASTLENEFWTSHMVPRITSGPVQQLNGLVNASISRQHKLGCHLDDTDINEILEFMLDFSSKQIVPYMEQKIRSLNQQVVATRKGLKNQIKNLWWRKGKDENTDVANGPMYTFSSVESQIRVLADYAFMLHDYELALSNYRLLSTDYKADKAWKRYAGVQEMIGLSLFMLDQSRKEAEYCMETAFGTYQKLGASGQRYSTRCALWLSEMLKARGQYKDAASVFSRASAEEPNLRAAILLEQAAYCYLRATPPMLRKFGFHLVLAGNRYNACLQKKHAIRAYMCVLSVYEGQGWNYISDHVHFHLGRLSSFLGRFDVAVQHYMRLLACSHQSPTNQATFLKEFLYVVQNQDTKQAFLKLDLPSINMETLWVHFEDHRTYASTSAAALPEATWLPLETALTPLIPSTVTTWLDAGSKHQLVSGQAKEFEKCVAGEEIRVDIEIANPLQIPVSISSVSLICEFISGTSKEKLGRSQTCKDFKDIKGEDLVAHRSLSYKDLTESQVSRETTGQESGEFHDSSLDLSEESYALKAGEKVMAHLKVVPKEQGILLIGGVKWILSGIVTGRCDFAIQGPKKKRLKGRNKNEQEEYFPHQCLKFNVLKHVPRLEVSLHRMPAKISNGEIHRLVLELSNSSAIAVKRIKLNTSFAGILLVGNPEDLDAEFPSCFEACGPSKAPTKITANGTRDMKFRANDSIYIFPEDIALEGGSTLLWPVWLHARDAGVLLMNNVLYYEADAITDLRFRTVRMSHSLQVLPSLRIHVQISPCLFHLDQYLLRLDIENEHSSESFWLRQVSCVGNQWHIAPLLPPIVDFDASEGRSVEVNDTDGKAAFLSASVCPSQLLPAGQTLSLFFQLLDAETGNLCEKCQKSIDVAEFTSDVRLGPPSSNEPLIDVTTGPLNKFHQKEMFLQKGKLSPLPAKKPRKKTVVDSSMKLGSAERTVDFILISEQQEDSTLEKPTALRDSQRLATHHSCHCSVKDSSPLVWVMEGPRTIIHNFSFDPFCEIFFYLTIRNCSSIAASVKVETLSSSSLGDDTSSEASTIPVGSQAGWSDLSLDATGATTAETNSEFSKNSDSLRHEEDTIENITPCAPFIWCSRNSTRILHLKGGASAKVPLCIAVFAPGIYDLSGYKVSWQMLLDSSRSFPPPSKIAADSFAAPITRSSTFVSPLLEQLAKENIEAEKDGAEVGTGMGAGHPFLLTVLQSKVSQI